MRASLRDPGRRALLVAGCFVLLSLGALQAMYGPAFPGLTERYGVGVDRVGTSVILHFGASFLATAASGVLLIRGGYRRVLFGAGIAMTAGALTVAFAPAWAWVLVGASLAGLGFGMLNVGFNLLAARVFAPNAAPALNLLSALFGIGSMLGPLAVGAADASLRFPFTALALVTAVATALMLRVPEPASLRGAVGTGLPFLPAAGFVALFALYVAAESGVATWETLHLEEALGVRAAAYMTSVYWGAVTVGRLFATAISARVRPRTLVLVSVAVALVALLFAHVLRLAPVAYAAVGLAFAPVFPTTLAWIERVFPLRSERVVPIALAAANLGPVAATAAIGAWVAAAGPSVVPTALSIIVALLLLVVAFLWHGTRDA